MERKQKPESGQGRPLLRVLYAEDVPADAELALHELKKAGYDVRAVIVETLEQFAEELRGGPYDVILADYRLKGWTGLAALEELRREGKDIPFILVTGSLGDELAVECIKAGAADYVLKDGLARLPVAVKRALEEKGLREGRRRAEEALRVTNEKLRALIEASPAAIVVVDPLGGVQLWNPAAERLFGWTAEEALGQRLPFVPPEKQEESRALMERVLRGESFEGVELERRRKDGSRVQVSLSTAPLHNGEGRVVGVVGVIADITERKRAEEQLRELSGRLLRVQDEERRRLARELHDTVAQALAAMVLNLSRFQEPEWVLDPQVERVLASSLGIAEQCAREVRTLTYLLHPPLLEELGLVSALRSYAEGFTERSGIRVELEAPPVQARFPAEVELALFRVAQESLANVHRHSGSAQARIRLRTENGELRLEICDAGRGVLPSVLEKFERGGAELGVGLAGMRERLRQLGGRLEVRPENPGTTVRATLPLPTP